ncbi:MAG: putative transrane anti-sigma factor [Rhodospirillales bacterium]|nr:putative transrane anti-sigma factor [Rhodospirillales bacterium]
MMREIDHLEVRNLLHAALDGELDTLDMMRFEAHLSDCTECTAEYARLSALSAAIRERVPRYAAPAELRDALLQSLMPREAEPPKVVPFPASRLQRWLRPAAGGFTLGAALAASLAVMIATRNVENAVTDSVVTAHIRALQPGHLTDVQISDQHQVKPWFDGKIDFAPPVKELSDQGFNLVGGRLDYIQGREAAVIVYRRKLHMIDLFVTRSDHAGSGAEPAPAPRTTPSGYNVEHWTDGGLDYWAVSDLNRNELADFAKAWQGR